MTETLDKAESVLGQPMRRKEDARLITGQTQWTDNISLPGMDREAAQALVNAAHHVCPYSNATRGNIDVTLNLV